MNKVVPDWVGQVLVALLMGVAVNACAPETRYVHEPGRLTSEDGDYRMNMKREADKAEQVPSKISVSSHYEDGRFHNIPEVSRLRSGLSQAGLIRRFLFTQTPGGEPDVEIPVKTLLPSDLQAAPRSGARFFRLGHSTILAQFGGRNWLIDPVFAQRASPFSFLGPKRFHQPPISLADLPVMTGVIISHNHYDHLDKKAVKHLRSRAERFIVPLGLGATLQKWGVDEDKIVELDWWQETRHRGLRVVATPAQHFSGRGMTDANATLWASFVMQFGDHRVFFSGDSGYFPGFKSIGDRFGPFELTIIEAGAYDDAWPHMHMAPEETLRAHRDLRGAVLMPVHNGTFNLAFHRWDHPFESIYQQAQQQGIALALPLFGEAVDLSAAMPADPWWHQLNVPQTASTMTAVPGSHE